MKIAFYINILANGGAERVVATLANALSQDNEVIVITSFPCDREYFLDKNVRRINIEQQEKKDNFIFRNIRRIRGLRQILKENKPDSLVSFMGEPNFRSIVACFGLKIKTVISVRNDPAKEYDSLLFRFLAKTLFCLADYAVFQTEDAQHWFPKSIQNKSCVILNPVANVFFDTCYDGERHNIVTTGRLVPQKNHKLLIKAFARIADKIEDNLYIYGEGFLRAELERLISELKMEKRIFLPGAVKNVPETIKTAKLFVLSSDFEGMPNSLMEAMALGIPCVSTDCPCGGPKMLLNKNFLVPIKDISRLSGLILEMVKKNIQPNNYLVDVNRFRSQLIIKEWIEAIQ